MCLPQIAKDVKQFYDQALQQALVDDEANNAKAVVKTFHETVWARGRWGTGRVGAGHSPAGLESGLSPDLRNRRGHSGPSSPAPQGAWAPSVSLEEGFSGT